MFQVSRFWLVIIAAWVVVTFSVRAQDASLQAVKDAIQKAETARPGSLTKDKALYTDAYLQPILTAIESCFSKPSTQILNARLEFEPHYYDYHDYTKVVRKEDPNAKYKPIGGSHTYVEVEEKNKSKHIDNYTISGGDVDVLRGAESVCLALQLAMKDTQLDAREARRQCPALKSLHSLLEYLPRYAKQYLDVEGVGALRYKNRLAQVEKLRNEVVAIQKEWLAEMAKLRKSAK